MNYKDFMIEYKNQQRTSLAQLGEFGLIEHLTKNFDVKQSSTLKSIGDDAAVLDFATKKLVVSTDLLIEGVHFNFTKAIQIDSKDASSYYNRGATKLKLKEKESACLDFSKAGELGDAEAYEAIKNFCN